MIAIKARYDGNSFIPLEPVSLPSDCNVVITLDTAGENAYADNEEAKSVAARILKKHIKAFEELAK